MSIVFHPDLEIPGPTVVKQALYQSFDAVARGKLATPQIPPRKTTGPMYLCSTQQQTFYRDNVDEIDFEKSISVYIKIDWQCDADKRGYGTLSILPVISENLDMISNRINCDILSYFPQQTEFKKFDQRYVTPSSGRILGSSSSLRTTGSNYSHTSSETQRRQSFGGMNTAVRAATRARQDAQYKSIRVPNEPEAKKKKKAFLHSLNSNSTENTIEEYVVNPSSSNEITHHYNQFYTHPQPSQQQLNRLPHLDHPVVVPLPVTYKLLSTTSMMIYNTSHLFNNNISHMKGDIVISFLNTDALVALAALLDAIMARSEEGRGRLITDTVRSRYLTSPTAAVDNFSPTSSLSEIMNSPTPLTTYSNNKYVNDNCVMGLNTSYSELSAQELRKRLDQVSLKGGNAQKICGHFETKLADIAACRDEIINNDVAVSPTERVYSKEFGNDCNMPSDSRIATDLQVMLSPGGRIICGTDGNTLPPSADMLLTVDPLNLQENSWKLQTSFDIAKEAYFKHESRRKLQLSRLFEERDRRRESFLRKRALLRDDIMVPTVSDGVCDADNNAYKENGAERMQRDEMWDSFTKMADALGRKWERSTVQVDKILMASASPHRELYQRKMPSMTTGEEDSVSSVSGGGDIANAPLGQSNHMFRTESAEKDFFERQMTHVKGTLENTDIFGDKTAYKGISNFLADLPLSMSSQNQSSAMHQTEAMMAMQRLRDSRRNSSTLEAPLFSRSENSYEVNADKQEENDVSKDELQTALKAEAKLLSTVSFSHSALAQEQNRNISLAFSATASEEEKKPVTETPQLLTAPIYDTVSTTTATTVPPITEEPVTPYLKLNLPAGWREVQHPPSGRTYYIHNDTKKTAWTIENVIKENTIIKAASAATPAVVSPAVAKPATATKSDADTNDADEVPAGWKKLTDPKTGRTYYMEITTRKTVWKIEDAQKGAVPSSAATTVSPLPAGWIERKDPNGRTYYIDTVTRKTTWTKPV